MCRLRTLAAVAAGFSAMLSMSACSLLEDLTPPPLSTAFSPLPRPPAPPSLEPPNPDEASAEMARWFAVHGYKEFQIEALLEHARVESGFRPCAAGPGGYRYTFQWGGGRLQQLQEFAHTDGCPQLHAQLAFADNELRYDPKFACFWDATSEPAALRALRRGFGGGSC
jgi:hypothetical protein